MTLPNFARVIPVATVASLPAETAALQTARLFALFHAMECPCLFVTTGCCTAVAFVQPWMSASGRAPGTCTVIPGVGIGRHCSSDNLSGNVACAPAARGCWAPAEAPADDTTRSEVPLSRGPDVWPHAGESPYA